MPCAADRLGTQGYHVLRSDEAERQVLASTQHSAAYRLCLVLVNQLFFHIFHFFSFSLIFSQGNRRSAPFSIDSAIPPILLSPIPPISLPLHSPVSLCWGPLFPNPPYRPVCHAPSTDLTPPAVNSPLYPPLSHRPIPGIR